MTPHQIQLVQSSFKSVRPVAGATAELFYAKLFDLDPSLRSMFRGDMGRQRVLLMTMLTAAVDGLDNIESLVPTLKALGARHAGYGVADSHYQTVGNALLYTLEAAIGPEFSNDVRDAWVALYTTASTVMQQGAAETLAQQEAELAAA